MFEDALKGRSEPRSTPVPAIRWRGLAGLRGPFPQTRAGDGGLAPFLLTGSAHGFLLPRLSESLAGRMEVLTLMSLGQDEMAGHGISLPDALFSEDAWEMRSARLDGVDICGRVIAGGYPEVVGARVGRAALGVVSDFGALYRACSARCAGVANIEGLTELARLLGVLAARSSGLLNIFRWIDPYQPLLGQAKPKCIEHRVAVRAIPRSGPPRLAKSPPGRATPRPW